MCVHVFVFCVCGRKEGRRGMLLFCMMGRQGQCSFVWKKTNSHRDNKQTAALSFHKLEFSLSQPPTHFSQSLGKQPYIKSESPATNQCDTPVYELQTVWNKIDFNSQLPLSFILFKWISSSTPKCKQSSPY